MDNKSPNTEQGCHFRILKFSNLTSDSCLKVEGNGTYCVKKFMEKENCIRRKIPDDTKKFMIGFTKTKTFCRFFNNWRIILHINILYSLRDLSHYSHIT